MHIHLFIFAATALCGIISSCNNSPDYPQGTVVCARLGNEWLQGIISSCNNDTIEVKFYDGFTSAINRQNIFIPNSFEQLENGDKVLALWKPGVFLEAEIKSVGNYGCTVQYDKSSQPAFVEFTQIVKL